MPKFVVTHGSHKTGRDWARTGDTVELSAEEKAHLDPTGERFCSLEIAAERGKASESARRLTLLEKVAQLGGGK
jgi:hypothetical protein